MTSQIEIGTGVDTFDFLESERHFEFDVGSGVCIVCQLVMIMESVFMVS